MADSGSDFGMVMTELVYVRVVRSLQQQLYGIRCESIRASFTDVVTRIARNDTPIEKRCPLFSFKSYKNFKYTETRCNKRIFLLILSHFSIFEISPRTRDYPYPYPFSSPSYLLGPLLFQHNEHRNIVPRIPSSS